MYRYFIQPQVNTVNNNLIGYELLMKEATTEGWRPPTHFSDIPAHIVADVLVATTSQIALKVPSVSINLNRTQLLDPEVNSALIKAQIQRYLDRGMELSLDDVDSGSNDYDHIEPLLPYAKELKFALQNFKDGLEDPHLNQRIDFWRMQAKLHNMRFILEGIEDKHDDTVANYLGIDLRQGYYYGKPHLLRLSPDDPKG